MGLHQCPILKLTHIASLPGRATTTQHTEAPELETPESLTPAMDTPLRPMTAIALTRTLSPTSHTTSNINLEAVVPQHLIYILTHNFCFL